MKLQFAYFDGNDKMVADFSADVERLLAGWGEHGCESLEARIDADLAEAARWRRDKRFVRPQLSYGPFVVWDGRNEDAAMAASAGAAGLDLAALGFWRAFRDVPYTGLFSETDLTPWKTVTADDIAAANPSHWATDKQNRLMAELVNGELYGNAADKLIWVYKAPHLGQRKISRLTFNYDYVLPVDFVFVVRAYDEGFTSGATIHTVTTAGGTAAGSATVSGFTKDFVTFEIYNNSGGPVTFANATGTSYAKVTIPRVMTGTTINADTIVSALVTYVNGINPTQISAETSQIQAPAVDLSDEVYEDDYPADIISDLVGRGDDQTPPRRWEVVVDLQQIVHFRPKGSESRTWAIDAADLHLSRTLEAVENSVYATYQQRDGRTLRTAAADDTESQALYGIIRRRAIKTRTTSATQAAIERDARLDQKADPPPRAGRLRIDTLLTPAGAEVELWELAPGDVVVVQNLPIELLLDDPDQVASFRVRRLTYDPLAMPPVLTVEPETMTPAVEMYLALSVSALAESGRLAKSIKETI